MTSENTTQNAFEAANEALADLQVLECALRAAADINMPIEAPTRQAVLERAVELLHAHTATLESALDALEDHVAMWAGNSDES